MPKLDPVRRAPPAPAEPRPARANGAAHGRAPRVPDLDVDPDAELDPELERQRDDDLAIWRRYEVE